MNLKDKEDKIKAFWKWFVQNQELVIQVYENSGHKDRDLIVVSLDNFVLDLGRFSWTIGEGKDKPYYFTISPNGDKDLLKLSKHIMQSCPELDKWEFNYANPINDENLMINLFDDYMQEQVVDASTWNFVLEKNADNTVNIIIEAENIPIADYETRTSAGLLVVSKLIGEELMINKVNKVEVSANFKEQSQYYPVRDLKNIMDNLVK